MHLPHLGYKCSIEVIGVKDGGELMGVTENVVIVRPCIDESEVGNY